jgi:Flp pilus assembly protein TadG
MASGLFRDRRGVAAVEFALLSTFIFVPLIIGLVEILTLFRSEAKLATMAADTAEMVSIEAQSTTNNVTNVLATSTAATSLQDVCHGAVLGLQPLPATGMTLDIAGVTMESGPNGTTGKNVNSAAVTYDVWEQDFTVSGTTCTPSGASGIGASAAEAYATSSPPSLTGTPGTSGLIEYPCDNAIVVQASMVYPGMIGLVLPSRPTLTQVSGTRWRYASPSGEIECTACSLSTVQSPQLCNTTNTGNN